MRERLIVSTYFFTIKKDPKLDKLVEVPCALPKDVVATLRARASWPGIRRLEGLVQAPTLRADGTVLQEPGYEAASELLFDPGEDVFPLIPDRPTKMQAVAALDKLLDVIGEFPFANEAHRSGWIACLLTVLGRTLIAGPTPLFALDANIRGSGKSLLADAISIVATGRSAPRMNQPESDAEMRKCITALLLEGERLALVDNVNRPLGSSSFDALLTSELWKDRILGLTKSVTVPNNCTWLATGNNLTFVGDTVRRTLHIRIDSPEENPEDRVIKRYPDLKGHVRAHRGELASAALTILRAFIVAGAPCSKVKLWGSFEDWSKTIAAACVWIGLPDPESTRIELEATADPEKTALAAVLRKLPELIPTGKIGTTAKNAIAFLYPRLERGEERRPDEWDGLREAFEVLAPPAPGRPPSADKLGVAFRKLKKRVVGAYMLDCKPDRTGVAAWCVVHTAPKPTTAAGDSKNAGDANGTPSMMASAASAGRNNEMQGTQGMQGANSLSDSPPTSLSQSLGSKYPLQCPASPAAGGAAPTGQPSRDREAGTRLVGS
jgi:hypothetical protein